MVGGAVTRVQRCHLLRIANRFVLYRGIILQVKVDALSNSWRRGYMFSKVLFNSYRNNVRSL